MNKEQVIKQVSYWKDQLLDLKKSNQMISFKERKSSTMRIIDPSAEGLFDLFEKKTVFFANLFQGAEDEFFDEIDESELEIDEEKELFITVQGYRLKKKDFYDIEELIPVIETFKNTQKNNSKYVFSNASYRRQNMILRNLIKKAKLFREENSINILYLAIGFLNWFESKESNENIKSPLLLIPIELKQEVFDGPVQIIFDESELLFNETLIKRMELDFGLNFNYSFDDDQENYQKTQSYFDYLERQFVDKRWYIEEDKIIGLFSFTKINMVKDIEENTQELIGNPMIQALSGLIENYGDHNIDIDFDDIDKYMNPENLYQVLDADSSQEYAIQNALTGKSFVLQGPPGTGKSQTITNIISELIARGKKVLFVAEKKAALDVVYNNLKKVGIDQYALPLHNIKVDKKEIIKELNNQLVARQNYLVADEFTIRDIKLDYEISKDKLNGYGKALLKKRVPLNRSIYDIYGDYLRLKDVHDLSFKINNIETIDNKKLQDLKIEIDNFQSAVKDINYDPKSHVWYGFNRSTLGLNEKDDFKYLLNRVKRSIDQMIEFKFVQLPFQPIDGYNIVDLYRFQRLLQHLMIKPDIDENDFDLKNLDLEIQLFEEILEFKNEIDVITEKIKSRYDLKVCEIDIIEAKKTIDHSHGFIKRLFSKEYKYLKRFFKSYGITSKTRFNDLVNDVNAVYRLYELNGQYQKKIEHVEKYNAAFFQNQKSISDRLHNLQWISRYLNIASSGSISFSEMNNHGQLTNISFAYLRDKINNYETMLSLTQNTLLKLQAFFNPEDVDFEKVSITDINDLVEKKLDKFDHLSAMLRYNHSIKTSEEYGLSDFFKRIIDSKITNDYFKVFLKRYYLTIIDQVENQEDVIRNFKTSEYQGYQNLFQKSDRKIIEIVKLKLNEIIAKNTPHLDGLEGQNNEILTLRREANKSRKLLPLRVFFDRAANLILTLKPCLMMSPLSVSSYLKSSGFRFDTVIFDEASQIRPESALGAIFRAKQMIVVGDKEQLPPTNFFETTEEDSDDDNDLDAYKSILEVSDTVLKPISLKWHYRSKFEELIRISNREIYRDLITFPSKIKPANYEGVDFKYVENGVYYRRSANIGSHQQVGVNLIEAQAVVNEIVNHLYYHPDRSLGVVTFSLSQANAIEHELNKYRKSNQDKEWFFSEETNEPFFIKSIETVQGDERDSIIISVGYGKDNKGKMSMNFGPINKDGGYRRLNVAITRAKINVVLVSSIKHHDIDLNKTNSRGVQLLKAYLEYAEFGEDDKADFFDSAPESDSPFEEDVYDEVCKMGYKAFKQVGSSGYKIDIAVAKPDNHKHYVLGIECDGAAYHSSKTARDRDRLRQDILESRGWKIHRIWSTDWFKNRQVEIRRLKTAIQTAIESSSEILAKDEELFEIPTRNEKKKEKGVKFPFYPDYDSFQKEHNNINSFQYQHVRLNIIIDIVKELSPVHMDEMKKVIPFIYGRLKYTKVVDQYFKEDLRSIKRIGRINIVGPFLLHPDTPTVFRKFEETYSSRRDFENIHHTELEYGILEMLRIVKKMNYQDFQLTFLEYCGFKRSSESMREKLYKVCRDLEHSKKISLDENLIYLIELVQ